jgi:hypothetical protein
VQHRRSFGQKPSPQQHTSSIADRAAPPASRHCSSCCSASRPIMVTSACLDACATPTSRQRHRTSSRHAPLHASSSATLPTTAATDASTLNPGGCTLPATSSSTITCSHSATRHRHQRRCLNSTSMMTRRHLWFCLNRRPAHLRPRRPTRHQHRPCCGHRVDVAIRP